MAVLIVYSIFSSAYYAHYVFTHLSLLMHAMIILALVSFNVYFSYHPEAKYQFPALRLVFIKIVERTFIKLFF